MFSSAMVSVPQGVTPPAQLLIVPGTRVPVGSAMQIGDPVGLEGIDCPTGWCKHPRHGSAAEG